MSRLRPRTPSPALVVSIVALTVSLGGTSYAAIGLGKNSVGTKQLKNNAVTSSKITNNAVTSSKITNGAVTGSKINFSGVTVPNASHASSADNASHASSADNAGHASSADNATNAGHASTAGSATTAGTANPAGPAGGALTGTYPNPGLAPPESWHEIGTAGQPAFQNSWTNESPTDEVTAAFYKDPFGVVHLKGLISSGTNSTIFTLPAGDRPSKNLVELMWRTSGTGEVIVFSNGEVDVTSGTGSGDLDGITFTAGE